MDAVLEFFVLVVLFGPAVAIPYASPFLSVAQIFLSLLAVQFIVMLPIYELLDFLRYSEKCENRLLADFAVLTGRQMDAVKANAATILKDFTRGWGYLGYYLSVAFFSFAMGFGWAIVLAYALRLRKTDAFISVLAGSSLSFIFWYGILLTSAPFISAQVFMMLAIVMAFVFMFYGKLHQQDVMRKVECALRELERA